jgi:hypothetical protein
MRSLLVVIVAEARGRGEQHPTLSQRSPSRSSMPAGPARTRTDSDRWTNEGGSGGPDARGLDQATAGR